MIGQRVSGLSLPTVHWLVGGSGESPLPPRTMDQAPLGTTSATGANVVPLRRRLPDDRAQP